MMTEQERLTISLLATRIADAIHAAQSTLSVDHCILVAISTASDCGRFGGISEERLQEVLQAGAARKRVQ